MRVPITEICLLPAEFDEYQIGVDASVTFCLRELRVHCRIVVCVCVLNGNSCITQCFIPQAILLFTDAINHCLSLRFETAGK